MTIHCAKYETQEEADVTLVIYIVLRISRWIDDEEDRIKAAGEERLQCVVLDMGGELFLHRVSNLHEILLYNHIYCANC
jgi:hypothetical protein